ncbi:MAG TPA: FAD-dependent oxidoreductase [Thermoplasmata archaeon]|nr:FAD-dependent oxidoreductase [Thermoplasmata archaeon]HEV2429704.1 FAD-dependent oxidoreductase [Thermoplasmata archaeon]
MGDDFDAIVVGAGMAGGAAAIRLAQGKANVLLVERGVEPGQKNLSGGILWGHELDAILPRWWESMPVERHIVRKRFGMLTKERAVSFDLADDEWRRPPYVAHSVLRARTDAWLAKEAEKAGATVVSGVPVERLLWDGPKVRGIVQDGEKVTAPVTVLCDGANSRLSLGTPIRPNARLSGEATELGIKEVFRLPRGTIESRFALSGDEGHAEEWVPGFFPAGVIGGGFLYTNRDTLSVGLIVNIASLFGKGVKAQELLERFRQHRAIADRLAGGELVEYGAKLISSGWASRPAAFHGDGWMIAGDAAGFVFSNGIVIQGMNYAIRSGLAAADTVVSARSAGGTTPARLAEYDRRLEVGGILPDFREFEGMDRVKGNERFYGAYPEFASSLLSAMMTERGAPKRHLRALLEETRKRSGLSRWTMVRDAYSLFRNF